MIGLGAVIEKIVRRLGACSELDTVLGVLDLPQQVAEVWRTPADRIKAVGRLNALLALGAD